MIFPKSFLPKGFKILRDSYNSGILLPLGAKNGAIALSLPAKESLETSFKYGKSLGKIKLKIILPTEVNN